MITNSLEINIRFVLYEPIKKNLILSCHEKTNLKKIHFL